MKKLIIAIAILLMAGQAGANTVIEFTDTVKYWDGFSNNDDGYWWYKEGTDPNDLDVWGTPDLLNGKFIFNDQNELIEIYLSYKFPDLDGWNTFTLGDWFFGSDGVDGWDYVLSSPTNDSWTGLTTDQWKIYNVSNIDFETHFEGSDDAKYLYSDAPVNYIPRYDHPVKAIVNESLYTGNNATLSGWLPYNFKADIEYVAFWDLSKNPLKLNLNDYDGFYYGFAVTCGNDVIYGGPVPTPEPGTLFLLGTGLLSLGYMARRYHR